MSTRLARLAGVGREDLPATFYACLTRMIGCTATATESAAMVLGYDRLFNRALLTCDWSDPEMVARNLREVLPDDGPPGARDAAIQGVVDQFEGVGEGARLHCAQAMLLTERLPLPADVPDLIGFLWSRWDGKFPGPAGTDIPLPARIIPLARAVDLAHRSGGRGAAIAVAQQRRGTEFDPGLADLFVSAADEVLDGLAGPSRWDVFLDAEPGRQLVANLDEVTTIAETFADFVDQKSGWFLGHSRRVSTLAATAAMTVGVDPEEQGAIRLAGLLHDVGRAAVDNGIWDKPGQLTPRERQLAESHNYHTETVLRMSSTFAALAGPAALAHERADGSGYHHNHRATDSASALLGAADVYDALVHERPWRPAFTPDDAAAEVRRMSADGLLHPECASAVLTAASGGEVVEPEYPAGLTPREVEVIRLAITGMPTKTIAARLSISPKTADKHIQSVYDKTGARGRAPIALFAVEHGIAAL